jgi:CHAT domain-containing protein/tetratricopeptide (TPR) repeat protein
MTETISNDVISLEALDTLSERTFDDPEEGIVALETGVAAAERFANLPSTKRWQVLRAKLLLRLGEAYEHRRQGDIGDNIERALAVLSTADSPEFKDDAPLLWAQIRHNLGRIYLRRLRDDRAENVEKAIAACEAAQNIRDRDGSPVDWAKTQHNLALAYADRIRGDRADNIERAISAYQAALLVRTRESFPVEWAASQNNLANAFCQRIRGVRAENIERAIAIHEAALEVRTRDALPVDWATTQRNLALAYFDRIRGERASNLEHAIALNEATLQIYTRETFPFEWAMTQNNLANAYARRARGDRADNLERAIAHHEAALLVRTRENFPVDWAMTQQNLAVVHSDRIRGDRADNVDRAIALYEAALEVFTRQAFPVNWAWTQHNLALAYADRIRGEQADNLTRAVALYKAALQVRTRELLPREQLVTSRGLGQALLRLRRWPQGLAALSEARATFLALLGEGLEEAEARGLIEAAGPLFACAAYAAAEMGKNEQAFTLACEGRARLLATALRLRRLDLPAAEAARAEELRTSIREQSRTLEQVNGLQRTETLDHLATLRTELARLIAQSEARAGKDEPMAAAQRICVDGMVIVVPVVTETGGKLFIVAPASAPHRDEPHLVVVDVPGLTNERMKALMRSADEREVGWLSAFAHDIAWVERKRRSVRAVEDIGAQLWTLLVGSLEAALEKLGVAPDTPLAFLPSSGLGLLPLGLAQEASSGRRLIERREIIYAPSLAALDRQPSLTAPSLAAVINPTGDLIYAPIEGALAGAGFAERIMLDQSNATSANVLAALRDRSHWHFATHGTFDLEEARRSALAMKDGQGLSVGQLLEADDLGRPRLVVLSACETGLHDVERLPEEFVGFPGAFMTVGAQAVLGALWPVDDCATALLIARFYDGHLGDGLAPAAALRAAQLWLSSATMQDLAAYAQRKGAESNLTVDTIGRLQAAIAGAGAELVRFFNVAATDQHSDRSLAARSGEQPARPFAHPIYWAGFVLTGR